MADVKNAEAQETMEQIYAKYFCSPQNIDAVYHKQYYSFNKIVIPCIEDRGISMFSLEYTIRKAINMKNTGFPQPEYLNANAIRSVLANLPKLKDAQLKKRVLFYFRLRVSTSDPYSIRPIVARAALSNKLATYDDYAYLDRNSAFTNNSYLNDLIAQAKLDIKSEMEMDVPDYDEIKNICDYVKESVSRHRISGTTLDTIKEEFDADKIIAGADYVSNFEQTVEMKHVDALAKKEAQINELQKEVKNQRFQLKTIADSANDMRASLLSRGVNNHKALVQSMLQSER